MAAKPKGRIAPRIDDALLTETFSEQLASGSVHDALAAEMALPPLLSPRGQAASIDGCIWRSVTLSDPKAQRLRLRDARIESSDLANIDMTAAVFERVEFLATRLTGAVCSDAQWKSVLFQECKLDFALFRMARFEQCVFEKCNLAEADFYGANLTGATPPRLRSQPRRYLPRNAHQCRPPRLPPGWHARHARCHGWPHHQSGPGRAAHHPVRRARRVVIWLNSSVAGPAVFPDGSATRSLRGSAPACRV